MVQMGGNIDLDKGGSDGGGKNGHIEVIFELVLITIKPETVKHGEQFSWVPLPCHFHSGVLPNKVSWFIISMCVSLDDSFLRVRLESTQSPLNGVPLAATPKFDSAEAVTALSHLLFSVYLLNLLTYVSLEISDK